MWRQLPPKRTEHRVRAVSAPAERRKANGRNVASVPAACPRGVSPFAAPPGRRVRHCLLGRHSITVMVPETVNFPLAACGMNQ